jgi:zinc-ribbon domain
MGSLSIWQWLILFVLIGIFARLAWPRRKGTSIKELDEEAIRSGLRRCPFCAEFIRPEAIVCKHCGRDIQPENRVVG